MGKVRRYLFCIIGCSFICNCYAGSNFDLNSARTVLKAARETQYGQNTEDQAKKYAKNIINPILNYIPPQILGASGLLIRQQFEMELIKHNTIRYDHRNKEFSYQINYDF